jgi:hypothetical protein
MDEEGGGVDLADTFNINDAMGEIAEEAPDDDVPFVIKPTSTTKTTGKTKRKQNYEDYELNDKDPIMLQDFIDSVVDKLTKDTLPNMPFYSNCKETVQFGSYNSFGQNRILMDGDNLEKRIKDPMIDVICPFCSQEKCSTEVDYIYVWTYAKPFIPICKQCKDNK